MSRTRLGFVLAMEEDNSEAVDAPVEMVPETEVQADAAAADVADSTDQIEELVVASEEAADDAGTLEEISDVMAESVEKGEGLDETSAQITEVAVESIRNRLGIHTSTKPIPTLESFGSKSSRVTATRLALEGVKETIQRIWAAIISALKKAWEMVKSFFVGLVKNRGLLVKHLESVKARVEKMDDSLTQKEKTLKIGAAAAFTVGEKASAATAAEVLGDSLKLTGSAVMVATVAARQARELLDKSEGAEGKSKKRVAFGDSVQSELAGLGEVKFVGKDAVEGAKYFGRLAGGMTVGVLNTAEKFGVQVTLNTKKLAEEIEALDKRQMGEIVGKAIEVAKALEQTQKMEKDLKAVTDACNSASEAVIKGAGNAESDEAARKSMAEQANNVRQLNALVAKFGSSLPALAFKAAKAGGDYVNASLNNYGAKKEDEKKAD